MYLWPFWVKVLLAVPPPTPRLCFSIAHHHLFIILLSNYCQIITCHKLLLNIAHYEFSMFGSATAMMTVMSRSLGLSCGQLVLTEISSANPIVLM